MEDFEVRKLPERDYARGKELFDTCVVFFSSIPASRLAGSTFSTFSTLSTPSPLYEPSASVLPNDPVTLFPRISFFLASLPRDGLTEADGK